MNARAALPMAGALVFLAAAAAGCGILGGAAGEVSGQVGLVSIVQRVALLPGVDALDPSGPTAGELAHA